MRYRWLALVGLALSVGAGYAAQRGGFAPGAQVGAGRGQAGSEFIILGTASGPNSEAARAQPANALLAGGQLYLIDAGDGAVAQLAKANLRVGAVRGVFLSHLHFDHTAGMLAVIGLRMQLETRGTLRVYGPPGTKTFIDGLLAASAPAMRAGYGIPGQGWSADIQPVELKDGAVLTMDGFKVTVAENSHFSMPEGNTDPAEGVSLSYRFDLADRSIVYTGDTGPSKAVVALARGADLLVSEMIDVDGVLAGMGRGGARATAANAAPTGFEWHMRAHHMTPTQVGELARAAEVKRVVITHFAPNPTGPDVARRYLDSVHAQYAGDVQLGADLGRY
ncbi:MAG TPA: MBL fold metallo-hydrolase [Terriglobia bacterium]|nr:MBL fold metallo-hydrolase [Terriglobia bacterium]